jgi:hypothetical protein
LGAILGIQDVEDLRRMAQGLLTLADVLRQEASRRQGTRRQSLLDHADLLETKADQLERLIAH